MDKRCDCREMWDSLCLCHNMRLNYMDDKLNNFPAFHGIYFNEYMEREIISMQKNDETLYKYLCKNNLLENGMCYHRIANKLCIKDSRWHFTHDYNVIFLIDYLVWSYGRPNDENNLLEQRIKIKNQEIIVEKYKSITCKVRIGQIEYREDLVSYHGKCQVCGIENKDLLVASHIKDFSESNSREARDFYNGFLLCREHDGLFDKGLISFTDEGNVIISVKLSEHDIKIIKPEAIKIDVLDKQKKYIKWHRDNKFRR